MSKRWLALLGLPVAFMTTGTSSLNADDWPQWAGPKRDGIWRETGILEKFPADGPKVLWRIPIGAGYSGPAVVGDRLYITDRPDVPAPAAGQEARISKEAIPGVERVLCLDTKTGKQIWEHKYDCPYQISYPSGPRTTPKGSLICAAVAGPPSPLKPRTPVPATVEMVHVAAVRQGTNRRRKAIRRNAVAGEVEERFTARSNLSRGGMSRHFLALRRKRIVFPSRSVAPHAPRALPEQRVSTDPSRTLPGR